MKRKNRRQRKAPDEVSARQDREDRGQGSVRFHIV